MEIDRLFLILEEIILVNYISSNREENAIFTIIMSFLI